MNYFQTCRMCKKASYESPEGMVRFGIRHWTHWTCGIAKWGFLPFMERLHDGQIAAIPNSVVQGHPDREAWLKKWQAE